MRARKGVSHGNRLQIGEALLEPQNSQLASLGEDSLVLFAHLVRKVLTW